MTISLPQGDLARAKVHEPESAWPAQIEIVATWKYGGGRRGKKKRIIIDADRFFGRHGGAPMSGDELIMAIDRLRKS